jgi:CheY-like chemotaxis protein
LSLANNELKHRASIVVELGKPPNVLADRNRLAQVFLNLLVRAAQAIPVGDAKRNEVRIRSDEHELGAVVEITDTGTPIPPELRAHIFEPFIATKAIGPGTGLALSICNDIVRDLGGTIEVHSPADGGTRFRVRLPRAPEVTTARIPVITAAVERRARVLVIDDDPMVARVVERAIGALHHVEIAATPREGLARIVATSFDVILCDLMMPDMTGMELHADVELRAPAAAARMVFMTGGAFTDEAERFLDRVPNLKLWKPFEAKELRETVLLALTR